MLKSSCATRNILEAIDRLPAPHKWGRYEFDKFGRKCLLGALGTGYNNTDAVRAVHAAIQQLYPKQLPGFLTRLTLFWRNTPAHHVAWFNDHPKTDFLQVKRVLYYALTIAE